MYVNAASHGLPDGATVTRMLDHLRAELHDGAIAAADAAAQELQTGQEAVARLVGARTHTVGLHATTTSAWLEILSRAVRRPGRVLVAGHEWGDHVRALHRLARCADVTVEVLPPERRDGRLDTGTWVQRIDEDVLAVFVPMVTSVDGLTYPVEAIGALDRPDDALLVVDAAQALGRVPVDVDRLGCDALVATGRKWLRGPRELAMFQLSERFTRVTGATASDLQPADVNVALRLGLGVAAHAVLRRGVAQVSRDLRRRSDRLRASLIELGYELGEPGAPGTVSLPLSGARAERVATALEAAGIVAKRIDALHVEPLAVRAAAEREVLRLAPHVYNSEEDIDEIVSIFGNDRRHHRRSRGP